MLAVAARASLLACLIALDVSAPARNALELAVAQAGVPAWLQPTAVVGLAALALGAAGEILAFPFLFRADWLLARRYGLSRARFGAWWREHARTALLTCAAWVAGAVFVYAAIGFSATRWWLVAGATYGAGTVALALIGPILLRPAPRTRPLARRGLTARLEDLARRVGAPVIGVHAWPDGEASRPNAALVGVGSARRVLLSDTLVSDYSDAEIEVVLAHELAHHLHRDIWKTMAFRAAVVCGACWIGGRALAELGPTLGLSGAADAAGLPALALLVGGAAAATLPAANLLSRRHERRADRFALDVTGNHEAFVSGLRRMGREHLVEERPTRLVKWCFHSHPTVADRVAEARRHRALTRRDGPVRGAPTRPVPGQRHTGVARPRHSRRAHPGQGVRETPDARRAR